MIKLKPEFKAQWLDALRSGKYPQGTVYLRRKDFDDLPGGFCCLGVGCDITDSTQWNDAGNAFGYDSDSNICIVPIEVAREWFVDCTSDGQVHNVLNVLTSMNDGGKDFATIADWIEANL